MDVLQQKLYNPTPTDSGGLDQTEIRDQGNAWILDNYPEVDIITSVATESVARKSGGGSNSGTEVVATDAVALMAPAAVPVAGSILVLKRERLLI
jgi:hypothetical protein